MNRNESVYTVNSKCSEIIIIIFFFEKANELCQTFLFDFPFFSFYMNSWMLMQSLKCSGKVVFLNASQYPRHILSDDLHIVQTFLFQVLHLRNRTKCAEDKYGEYVVWSTTVTDFFLR